MFLAVGAHIGKRAYIPAGSAARVLDAVSLLRSMEGEEPPLLGRRVAVYGGGNTAMDAARTAKRLGAEEAIVVYRRTRDRMPAHDFEVEEAEEEGVLMKWLSTVKHADAGKLVRRAHGARRDRLPAADGRAGGARGRLARPRARAGDRPLAARRRAGRRRSRTASCRSTGHDDRPPGHLRGRRHGPGRAHGHRRRRARQAGRAPHRRLASRGERRRRARSASWPTFAALNTWYYADAPRTAQPQLELARRQSTFEEVVGGLDETNALFEARRCLSCGNCFSCDNCYGVCPDNAVLKLDAATRTSRYAIDYDYCKGCGICAAECPCGAIEMVPETI